MRETSWIDRRPGTVELRARIERDGHVETVRIVADESLAPRGVYVAVRGEAGWRTLEALPKREGGWLAVVVSAPDGARRRADLDLPREVVVDYPAAAVEAFARERLALAPARTADVAVLRVIPPALDVLAATRRYVWHEPRT
ncbi:MAG TPA: hypothetical protein VIM86_08280 [Thermodesulfobacteriota bacterium]